MPIYKLPDEPYFPDPNEATEDGLLAIGGDLSPQRLVVAYASGIFPWFNEHDPIMWWSPDPRMVLFPERLKVSKSLKQTIRKEKFELRIDTAFTEVILNCKTVSRKDEEGTWITDEMIAAYKNLYKLGLAHSFETWLDNELVGGLYGISLGNAFFGESMFSKVSDASKVAFYYLSQYCIKHNFSFIDCQITNPHLQSLGAEEIPRVAFLGLLEDALKEKTKLGLWD
ncbi:MAG: leucyl/phenylalanyl-tRNA--protein transferase [Salinivirgaceae bacterium]|nr:leucyl/phenylalanyl-tRNA--protein transferase [Salinivirgaceae bacterium]